MKKGIFVTIYAFLLLAFPSVGVCDFPGIPSSSSGSTVTDADSDGAADLAQALSDYSVIYEGEMSDGFLTKYDLSTKKLKSAGAPTTGLSDAAVGERLIKTGTTTIDGEVGAGLYGTVTATDQGTANINIDGVSYADYNYSNGASAATYTPVITSAPASGKIRYITLTLGGGAGVVTLTATHITWIGTAGAAATTTNKKSTYACMIPATGNALCKIVAEAY
jgi:hypothetical protein